MNILAMFKQKKFFTRKEYRHGNKILGLATKFEPDTQFGTSMFNLGGIVVGSARGEFLGYKSVLPTYMSDLKCILSGMYIARPCLFTPIMDKTGKIAIIGKGEMPREGINSMGEIVIDHVDIKETWQNIVDMISKKWNKEFYGSAEAGLYNILSTIRAGGAGYSFVLYDGNEPDTIYCVSRGTPLYIERIKEAIYITDEKQALGDLTPLLNFNRNVVEIFSNFDTIDIAKISSAGISLYTGKI